MTILEAVVAFSVVAGLLTLTPGLDTALVLRSSLTRTRKYAWATAVGVATGAMTWGIAAAVGVSALLAASEVAYRMLTVAGAAYMLWLGASMLWKSLRRSPHIDVEASSAAPSSALQGWLTGLGTNLLNPKVGVFYIAMIPQFMPAEVSPLLMGVLLAAVHCVLTMLWFTGLILGGRFASRWLRRPRALAFVDGATGVVLLGFGGKLLGDAMFAGGAPSAGASAA